jgi:2'-5' RNA ligase
VPRLFLGVELPDAYRQLLTPAIEDLSMLTDASVNWSKAATWHLTLKFLGETDETRIPALKKALAAVDFSPFIIRAGGAGAFPDARRPKVLWAGLDEGGEQIAELARSIEDALAAIGFPREEKRFRPHLTLGQVRRPATGDWSAVLDAAATREWPPFTVDRFILWRSRLEPAGAVHNPVAEFTAQ